MDAVIPRLHDPLDRPFTKIVDVALAISQPGEDQRHIGVLYRDAAPEGGISMLHLKWHHRLRSSPPESGCLWIELDFDPALSQVLRRTCRRVADKYAWNRRSIAYALRYEKGSFNPKDGEFLTRGGHGLTCATFVLALFASHSLSLVCGEEWLAYRDAAREEIDRAWQETIVNELQRTLDGRREKGAAAGDIAELEAHIAAVKGEIGCARFRPEEVAAAATSPTLPASFAYAEPVGRRIVEKLQQRSA